MGQANAVMFSYQRRVEFSHTDMAGIAHFTNFFRYMEEAEHAFLRSRGLSVVLEDDKGKLGFPKLEANCDYKRPAHFEEVLDIQVKVSSTDRKTVLYECTIRSGSELLGQGHLRVAFCRFPNSRPPYAIPISEEVFGKLFGDETVNAQ